MPFMPCIWEGLDIWIRSFWRGNDIFFLFTLEFRFYVSLDLVLGTKRTDLSSLPGTTMPVTFLTPTFQVFPLSLQLHLSLRLFSHRALAHASLLSPLIHPGPFLLPAPWLPVPSSIINDPFRPETLPFLQLPLWDRSKRTSPIEGAVGKGLVQCDTGTGWRGLNQSDVTQRISHTMLCEVK